MLPVSVINVEKNDLPVRLFHQLFTMGKRAEQNKKRKRLNNAVQQSIPSVPTLTPDASDENLISEEDLEITIQTLQTLSQDSSLLIDKRYKNLKRASYDLHRLLSEGSFRYSSLFLFLHKADIYRLITHLQNLIRPIRLPLHRRPHLPLRNVYP